MICKNCQTPNPKTHHFCSHCGTLLVDYCPRCQFRLPGPVNFCGNCGLALTPRAQFFWLQDGESLARSALFNRKHFKSPEIAN